MWIEDIKMALFGLDNDLVVEKIDNGFIFFTNHTCLWIPHGVDAYKMAIKGNYECYDAINRELKGGELIK